MEADKIGAQEVRPSERAPRLVAEQGVGALMVDQEYADEGAENTGNPNHPSSASIVLARKEYGLYRTSIRNQIAFVKNGPDAMKYMFHKFGRPGYSEVTGIIEIAWSSFH